MEEPLQRGGPFGEGARGRLEPAVGLYGVLLHQRQVELIAELDELLIETRDQVTDQRPDIPLSARRGAIPLIGPDLPDELHIALADGVKGVQGVQGYSFLRSPPGTQGCGPLRPLRYPMRRTGRSEPAREVTAGQRSCEPIRR